MHLKIVLLPSQLPFATSIRFIEDDIDFAHFLDTSYDNLEIQNSVYLDHSVDDLTEQVIRLVLLSSMNKGWRKNHRNNQCG